MHFVCVCLCVCKRKPYYDNMREMDRDRKRVCVACVGCKAKVNRGIAEDLQVLHGNEKRDTNSFI